MLNKKNPLSQNPDIEQKFFARVAIVGFPNVGKSTLINSFIGQKASIVTHKRQTTRKNSDAIHTAKNIQVVFVDTPGVFSPSGKIEKAMAKAVSSAIAGADIAAIVISADYSPTQYKKELEFLMQKIETASVKPIMTCVIINKIDNISKKKLLPLIENIKELIKHKEVFLLSATQKDGTDDFIKWCENNASNKGWLYLEDEFISMSQKEYAAEICREKLFIRVHDELPYQLVVRTEEWIEKEKFITINQVIHVSSHRHKKILLGNKAEILKQVGIKTRLELEKVCGKKINLSLFVRVNEGLIDLTA